MSFRWLKPFILLMLTSRFALAQEPAETPAAVALRVRRNDAENRKLFKSTEPLHLTLEANFGQLMRDRDPETTKLHPGVLKVIEGDRTIQIPVQLSARGHLRRRSCDFIPILVSFPKPETKGTVFEMRASALKLITHCKDSIEFEQYILKEFLAYQIANLVIPNSFRARLARVTYVDSAKGKTIATRYAMFLEDDGDVARRLGGKITDRQNIPFIQLHPVALLEMSIFEFMIGNTDYSIMAFHNVRVVETTVGLNYPVPYDFDVSGLVNAPYGIPAPQLRLDGLTQRLYRGPCRTAEQLVPMLNIFRNRKLEILALADSVPDLRPLVRGEVKTYLKGFFSLIDKPPSVKHQLIDPCIKGGV